MKSVLVAVTAAATLLAPVPASAARTTGAAGGAAPAAAPQLCRAGTFDTAEVVSDPTSGSLTLVVSGMKSATNVTIELEPVIYIQQPEYWEIDVVACSSGTGAPVLTPYAEKLDVTHTVGTIGVEVVGANGSVRIPVFPGPVA